MSYTVTVVFGGDREYEFALHDADVAATTKDQARNWLARHGNPYSVTAADRDGRVAIEWGVYGVPETFVVDAAGKIRYKHIGPVTREILDGRLLPLVRQLAADQAP